MKRTPWLTLLLPCLLGALVLLTPAAAQPCPFCGRDTYLQLVPLVAQVPPPPPPDPAILVLRPEDTPRLVGYTVVDEAPVTSTRPGREAAYQARMQSALPNFLLSQVGRYSDDAAATADAVALLRRTDTTPECSAWEVTILLNAAAWRTCRLNSVFYENAYLTAARGWHVVSLEMLCRGSCNLTTLEELRTAALAKLP